MAKSESSKKFTIEKNARAKTESRSALPKLTLHAVLRVDYFAFVSQAFAEVYGKELEGRDYVKFVCLRLEGFAKSRRGNVLINLPPRHLKSFVAIICLVAWLLGHEPDLEILVVTGNDSLAANTVATLRKIMGSAWYQRVFPTRLIRTGAKTSVETTAGGILRVRTIGEDFTGVGGDAILVDDLAGIRDAGDNARLDAINAAYVREIRSRRNDGARTLAVVVQHRLAYDDLSGHLLQEGGWHHIVLSYEAVQDEVHQAGIFRFERKKGSKLRPDAFSENELAAYKASEEPPSYETFFQQRPSRGGFTKLARDCIGQCTDNLRNCSFVISVDPAQTVEDYSDFSCIQVWTYHRHKHVLVYERCARLKSYDLVAALRAICRKYLPSIILIEKNGPVQELARGIRKFRCDVLQRGVKNENKTDRFRRYVETVRAGGIALGRDVPDPEEFIDEIVSFPSPQCHDDRVDAMCQYLRYFEEVDGEIPERPDVGIAAIALGNRGIVTARPSGIYHTQYAGDFAVKMGNR